MKATVIFTMFGLAWLNMVAQIPQSFRYQAVARDNSGNVLVNQNVSFQINILSGSIEGTVVYSETHTGLTTNAFGLVELEIGRGTPVTGLFSNINWGSDNYYVKVEMDPAGGTDFQTLSTSQLLSVPYALHAKTVETGDNWGNQSVVTDASLTGNGTPTVPLKIANNGVSSAKIQDGTIENADLADNAVSTLKIADGSIATADLANSTVTTDKLGNLAVNSAKIQSGAVTSDKLAANAVTDVKIATGAVTGGKIAQSGAASGQALKWSGTTWAPANDSLALPYSGTGTSGSPLFNIVNLGTSGAISTFSSGNYGIWGESSANMGIGVYGVNKTSTGKTFGVFGDVYSSSGYSGYFQGGKVFIQGNTGIGIQEPTAKLEVAGQIKVTGGSPGAGKVLTSDAAGLASWVSPTVTWLKNGSNVYYSSGNVGVGLNNPIGMMEIYGNSVDSYPTLLLSEADGFSRVSFRTMSASAKHWVLAGHTNATDGDSQWHLNYNNGTVGKNIFSVYGNSNIAFDGNVGIGTNFPGSKLEVAGQVKITGGMPGAGKVLTSDANGLASWSTPSVTWLKNGSDIYYNTGRVAIGMTFPRYRLTIYDDSDSWIGFYNSTSGTTGTDGFTIGTSAAGSAVWIWNCENSNMHFGTNNVNRLIINADGHISMMGYLDLNTDGIFKALSVAGKQALWWDGTYFSWGYDAVWNYFADRISIGRAVDPGTSYMLYVQGTAFATGSWNSSDIRFKKNILPISGALEKVMKIKGNSFEFRNNEFKDYHFSEGKQLGFIAQELEKEFPELVKTESDGYKSVNYNGMIPVLLEAVKELKDENNLLKTEIQNVVNRLETIENHRNTKNEQ